MSTPQKDFLGTSRYRFISREYTFFIDTYFFLPYKTFSFASHVEEKEGQNRGFIQMTSTGHSGSILHLKLIFKLILNVSKYLLSTNYCPSSGLSTLVASFNSHTNNDTMFTVSGEKVYLFLREPAFMLLLCFCKI